MASVTISHTFSSAAIAARVGNAICANNGYQNTIDDGSGNQIPNPQTKLQFCKAWLDNIILNQVIMAEGKTAADTARAAAEATAKTDIVIS
jgi:hypothetical protein